MNEEKKYKLKTNSFNDFDEHLSGSNHVFLSAPYGLGKTTFLRNYINSKIENDECEYNFFHLYPVHYAVNKNEDVFELIKYDLLFELLKNDNSKKEIKVNFKRGVEDIVKKNARTILMSFIEKIPQIGKPLKEIVEVLEKTENDITQLFETDFQTPELNGFIKRIENIKGSVFENDIITQYINNKLDEIKGEDIDKENVLILDDLDRIEPNHLFRLLNIFSANFDSSEYSINKFGVDKVIIVADYYNIKSIYHHKYGKDSDFKGYINKFYSNEIYFLTFNNAVKNLFNQDYGLFEYPDYPNLKLNLLTLLFNSNQLNFRQMKRIVRIRINREGILNEIIRDLVVVFNDDYNDLINAFEKVSPENDRTILDDFWKNLFEKIIYFFYQNNEFRISEDMSNVTSGVGYFFNLTLGDIKQRFVRSGGDLIIKPYIDLNDTTKSMIWKEFIVFLKYQFTNQNN